MTTDPQTLLRKIAELEKQLAAETAAKEKAREDLECSREKLKEMLREIPAIVFATDADGSIIFFNREFERVTGFGADDLLTDDGAADLLIPDPGDDSGDAGSVGKDPERWQFESKDGQPITVKWSRISSRIPLLGWQSWKIGIDISGQEKDREKIKTLSGLLPICASCKKIRDDKGYWNQLEAYIREHSDAEFSHGICPDCIRKLYPNLS